MFIIFYSFPFLERHLASHITFKFQKKVCRSRTRNMFWQKSNVKGLCFPHMNCIICSLSLFMDVLQAILSFQDLNRSVCLFLQRSGGLGYSQLRQLLNLELSTYITILLEHSLKGQLFHLLQYLHFYPSEVLSQCCYFVVNKGNTQGKLAQAGESICTTPKLCW